MVWGKVPFEWSHPVVLPLIIILSPLNDLDKLLKISWPWMHGYLFFFLDSQFYSIDQYVSPCASTISSWLPLLCSKFCNWEAWLLLHSFFFFQYWFGHSRYPAISQHDSYFTLFFQYWFDHSRYPAISYEL